MNYDIKVRKKQNKWPRLNQSPEKKSSSQRDNHALWNETDESKFPIIVATKGIRLHVIRGLCCAAHVVTFFAALVRRRTRVLINISTGLWFA